MIEQYLLEKYFPKTFDDVYLPINKKNEILAGLEKTAFRLLLHGSPGGGKTTVSRLLSKDYETIYLSGSNDFNIDTIRNKIIPFASGYSVNNRRKLIIIDECENIRDNLQDSFKVSMDQMQSVSFIFITNEIYQVNDAIKSRCNKICFDFADDEMKEQLKNFVTFLKRICTEQSIRYTPEGAKKLYQLLFPDFRQLLITLQKFKDTNIEVNFDNVVALAKVGKENKELYLVIEDNTIQGKQLYEQLSVFRGKEKECFTSIGEPFFEHLNEQGKYDITLKVAIIVSKYSNMYVNSINKFTTLIACVVELKTLFR
jgi:replication-associated recombination protein RarA